MNHMPTTTYGVIAADDGSFLMACAKKRTRHWQLASVHRWESTDRIKSFLLLHRGVIAAVPSVWKKIPHKDGTSSGEFVYAQTDAALSPHAHGLVLDPFERRLSGNLLSIVPDDAYLATVPRALADNPVSSFVAVDKIDTWYKIGIIIDARLVAVFTMAPAVPDKLESHLGRIERYFTHAACGIAMPKHLYLLDEAVDAETVPLYTVTNVHCEKAGFSDRESLMAFGAALSGITGTVPQLLPASGRSAFRRVRAGLYAAAALLCACMVLLAAGIPATRLLMERHLDGYKKQYQAILMQNTDIRQMMEQNESLARSITALSEIMSHQTNWSSFLQLIGTIRPQGLYLDMLGSETLNAGTGNVRIAMSGWSQNESLVTDFISGLQKSKEIADVSLSSLERGGTQNIVNFKVVCSLKLIASSQAK
jgi:Tfp pilus assembly protein PilN